MARESFARSGAVSLLGSAFAAVSALVLASLVGHVLGARGTGIFYQAVAVFSVLTAILQLGTNSGLVRSVARQRALGQRGGVTRSLAIAVWPVLLAAVACGVALWFSAPWLAGVLTGPTTQRTMEHALRSLAPAVVAGSVLMVLHTMTRMIRGVTSFTVLQNVLLPLSRLVLVVVALAAGADQLGVLRAWTGSLPFWVVVTLCWVARPVRHDLAVRRGLDRGASQPWWRRRPDEETATAFWRFSVPRAVASSIELGLDWSDVLIVGALRSPAEAGVYAVASRAVNAGQVVARAMRISTSPRISELLTLGRTDDASALHTEVTRAMLLLSWPFYLTLIVMGPAVMRVFGSDFGSGARVLAILGAALLLTVSSSMMHSILLMGGRSGWQVYVKGAILVISVSLNLLLVPAMGIEGAAVTWAVVAVIDTAVTGWLMHRGMGVHISLRGLQSAALPPLVVFGVGEPLSAWMWGTGVVQLGATVLVLTVVYVAVLWRWRDGLGLADLWPVSTRRAGTGRAEEQHQVAR